MVSLLLPSSSNNTSGLLALNVALQLGLLLGLLAAASGPAEAKFDFGQLFNKNKQQASQSAKTTATPAAAPAKASSAKSGEDSLLDELKQLDRGREPLSSGALASSSAAARRHKLEKLREAMAERERLVSGGPREPEPAEAAGEQVPAAAAAAATGRRRPVVGAEQRARWQRQELEESSRDYDDQDQDPEGEEEDDDDGEPGGRPRGDHDDQDQDDDEHKFSKSGKRPAEGKFVNAAPNSNKRVDKSALKPIIKPRQLRPRDHQKQTAAAAAAGAGAKLIKSKLFSAKYLKKKVGQAYERAATVISDIPKLVNQASDSISAFLQLDNKGRILAMIEEVNEDIRFVRKEFSKFSITWTPIVERALNYLGDEQLDQVKWKNNDELDFRKDALHSLVFAYEFMRMMIAWRENLLVAHEAYKLYLETFKKDFIESKQQQQAPVNVDEDFIFQMKTIHSYMLLSAWLSVDEATFEPRLKLDHLMEVEDDRPKNYESEYFRNIIVLQELYEPTKAELDNEKGQVVEAISHAGALTQDFEDIDNFFDNFRNALASKQVEAIDWAVPEELMAPMAKLAPQLQYNQLVYSRAFLRDLKEAKEERASQEEAAE